MFGMIAWGVWPTKAFWCPGSCHAAEGGGASIVLPLLSMKNSVRHGGCPTPAWSFCAPLVAGYPSPARESCSSPNVTIMTRQFTGTLLVQVGQAADLKAIDANL